DVGDATVGSREALRAGARDPARRMVREPDASGRRRVPARSGIECRAAVARARAPTVRIDANGSGARAAADRRLHARRSRREDERAPQHGAHASALDLLQDRRHAPDDAGAVAAEQRARARLARQKRHAPMVIASDTARTTAAGSADFLEMTQVAVLFLAAVSCHAT